VTIRAFGTLDDGTPVQEFTISAGNLEAKVLNYGAVVRDLRVSGRPVVLGLERLEDYLQHSPYFGAIAGRYANRIAHGRFSLDGHQYQLSLNQKNRHHLHGGFRGFSRRVWQLVELHDDAVLLAITAKNGDEGYPGRVEVTCRYRLTPSGALQVGLQGTTDTPTLLNLAHHSYFNLDDADDVLDHRLQIAAERYIPVDAEAIPTGEIAAVTGTPFDFRNMRPIRWSDDDRVHYDHNFCIGPTIAPSEEQRFAAALEGPVSGLRMEVWTTEPGLQFYDGYMLDVPVPGLEGRRYGVSAGLCLEPQRWPDSPNHVDFTNAVLRPGETYRQITEYRFL